MSARYEAVNITIDNFDVLSEAVLKIETEMIDVTPTIKIEADMSWMYVDQFGHFHAFGHEPDALPTVEVDQIHHGGDPEYDDAWTEDIYRCRICKEVIEPQYKTRHTLFREMIPGRMSWKIEARATGPGAQLMYERNRRDVSIRIKAGDDGREFFGIGTLMTRDLEIIRAIGEEPIMYWIGDVIGKGPLGKRGGS